LVTNTPANCLEIYAVEGDQFRLEATVMVGMEPVAVAFADVGEAWVVNHLSDSVSIVDLTGIPRVTKTLQVGDEPRDIVFAGPDRGRAFITAAYRGQNRPGFSPEDLTRPGIGRADVWVYDRASIDQSLNGNPLAVVKLFADSPRALAVSPDGTTVYAAAFLSGNGSTTLSQDVVKGNKPAPDSNVEGEEQPDTGLIVRKRNGRWLDEAGTDWSGAVPFDLPDLDVYAINAMAPVPGVTRRVGGVGTVLFNLAVNPVSGELYVSNLEALNHIRFEGPGETATTVRGHIAESRISVVSDSGVINNHLNEHVDFDVEEGTVYPPSVVQKSLSQPTAMVVSPDGARLYLAAFGSQTVAAIPTEDLHTGSYQANTALQVETPGGGPSGLVLSSDGRRLVVYTRFDNAISLWDTANGNLLDHRSLFSPESARIVSGRRFLYDARETSANGTSACSSCHIFGDMDQLAWDLGNPDAAMEPNPNQYVPRSPKTTLNFHPMKGPMTTQTLRGIVDSGPQHWRGDRTGQHRETVNGVLESVEAAAFKEFNPAFVGLVGRAKELPAQDMQLFTDFAMALTPPPNPVRQLNNALTQAQARGRDTYFNIDDITGIGSCNHCHSLDPVQRQFGTGGLMSFEGAGIAENFKVPHFRNAYAKVGMFGTSGVLGDGSYQGNQIKGFGYLHDGSIATLLDFFASSTFQFPAPEAQNQADIVRFVMVADSNMAPIVGQQVTVDARAGAAVLARLDLLERRASITEPRPECDLIARGVLDALRYSALRQDDGRYLDTDGATRDGSEVRSEAMMAGNVLTFSCVPPGSGERLALDR
jgi:YVTN family beta-propeller protein